MKKNWLYILVALTLALTTVIAPVTSAEESTEHPIIHIAIRDYGDIYAELYPEYAPVTVENFLKLIGDGFYDGLTFHRIISGFMIQGGDPKGNGTGGSKDKIKGEFSQNGVDNPLKHDRGVLSMARSSDMNSASSQFFIMHADSPHLDGAYAAFGKVLCGMPAVDLICLLTPVQDNNGTVIKADQPAIESVRIVDPETANAARDAEEMNGLAGTVYRDPYTSLSFRVPAGWNRAGYPDACTAVFRPEADADKALTIVSMDVWRRYEAQLAQMGFTRETLNTDAAVQIGLLRIDASQYAQEQHSGTVFYTAQLQSGGVVYVGAHNGSLYQIISSVGRDDPLFADVTGILDSLSFE
ncbi:MAG: peptidylprolyl isomerase [Clostridia bacterium]|nr:peptidylprolyl isomerase [Clostridia bacterium]